MKIFAKLHGRYIGVDPSRPDAVYADRAAGGAWELLELQPRDGGLFLVRFVEADRVLSIQPDGKLETRQAGTDGAYELLRATLQPEGVAILYRVDDAGVVLGVPLTLEEA